MTNQDYHGVIDFLYSLRSSIGRQFDWSYLDKVEIVGEVDLNSHWSSKVVITDKGGVESSNTLTLGPVDVLSIIKDFLEKDLGLKINVQTKMLNTGTEIIETIVLTPYAGPDAGYYSERLYEKTLYFMDGRRHDLAHKNVVSWRLQAEGGCFYVMLEVLIKSDQETSVSLQSMEMPIFSKMTEGTDALSQALTSMGVQWVAERTLGSTIFPAFIGSGSPAGKPVKRLSHIIIRRNLTNE
jgi:hypothetical protein